MERNMTKLGFVILIMINIEILNKRSIRFKYVTKLIQNEKTITYEKMCKEKQNKNDMKKIKYKMVDMVNILIPKRSDGKVAAK